MKEDSALLAILGLASGTVSAYFATHYPVNTSLFAYMPGFCFGIVIAIVYILNLKHPKALNTLWKVLFAVLSSTLSYYVAVSVTIYVTLSLIWPSYEMSTSTDFIATAIGGFVGTSLLLSLLRLGGIRYAGQALTTAVYGSLAAAILFNLLRSSSGQEPTGFGILGGYVFYILWQTIILTKMGIPRTNEPTTSEKH
jgi:hypothetical protein